MKTKLKAVIILATILFTGCIFSRPEKVQNIVKDFNLGWQGDAEQWALYVNIDHEEYGGLKIIDKTVIGIGHNQDFILVMQQPDQTSDTVFHIIDIREYSERFWGPEGNVFSFPSEEEFRARKEALGISQLELTPL